jgi:hypothetical protein
MSSPMLGLGFTNTYASNSSSSSTPSSMSIIPFTATLDGSGLYDLTLANADTYQLLSVQFNTTVGGLCFVERYSQATTTAIRLRATDIVEGAGKTISGTYILASDI